MKNLKILIIDVGHGGTDGGAYANGIVEKTANLTTALALKEEAEKYGIKVFMTRSTDITMSLDARVNYANKLAKQYPNADIVFVSVHHNAGGGDRGEFIHSIYKGNGLKLADTIGTELHNVIGQQKKVYEKRGSDNKDYYYVIKNTSMDAIIVEVCFLDNALDVQIADTVAEQQRNGRVIAQGIGKYFGLTKVVEAPKPKAIDVFYQVYANGVWYAKVKNDSDYAGVFGKDIECLYANLSQGSIEYRVSPVNKDYYPWVRDLVDYAGAKGTNIDRLQMRLVNLPNHKVMYRVKLLNGSWLPWVTDTTDYAGVRGKTIEAIQVKVVNK